VLHGIRVLDFGRYIAGPYVGALLAEYGAEVIRIEKRDGSEDRWLTPVGDDGTGALFLAMNRNKRSMTLDPATPEGREVVRRLVATADVVIANLPAPTLKSLGLDWTTLCAIKPDLILVTSSAYGNSGPMANHVGFDGVGQVMSGAVYMTGEPDQPYRAQIPWVDFGTALHLAFGTMAALMARAQTGRGQCVQGSLLATAIGLNNPALIEQAVIQANRVASGNRAQGSGPTDLFRTRDGWILTQVVGQPLFERWARLMGEDHWLEDPRFSTDDLRGRNGEVISQRMRQWCAQRFKEQALAELAQARIPCAAVLSAAQALEHPQVQALGLLKPLHYPGLAKPAPVARAPVWLSDTPKAPLQSAPSLGEHTDEILRALGYTQDQIEELRSQGTI
jgi:crotonobetainyl-CoA:carnitine CoA-transferase CaiB-like acyl-CoA transferase